MACLLTAGYDRPVRGFLAYKLGHSMGHMMTITSLRAVACSAFRRRLPGRSHVGAVVCTLAGCGQGDADSRGGSVSLQPLQTTTLIETDTLPIGIAYSLHAGANGMTFVVDAYYQRVVAYSPTGSAALVFAVDSSGRNFTQITAAALIGDSLLVVFDNASKSATIADARRGAYVRTVGFAGIPSVAASHGDTLFVGLLDWDRQTSVGVLPPAATAFELVGYVPSEYRLARRLAEMHNFVSIAAGSSRRLVAYSGVDSVIEFTSGWMPIRAGTRKT